MHPYRSTAPEPEPICLMVAGHRIYAASIDEFISKLQALGEAINFSIKDHGDGHLSLTFASGDPVEVAACPQVLPN